MPDHLRDDVRTAGLQMYENYRLCEKLNAKEICLVVGQYKEGIFERQYHEHVRSTDCPKALSWARHYLLAIGKSWREPHSAQEPS
jgi:hypothetical protein